MRQSTLRGHFYHKSPAPRPNPKKERKESEKFITTSAQSAKTQLSPRDMSTGGNSSLIDLYSSDYDSDDTASEAIALAVRRHRFSKRLATQERIQYDCDDSTSEASDIDVSPRRTTRPRTQITGSSVTIEREIHPRSLRACPKYRLLVKVKLSNLHLFGPREQDHEASQQDLTMDSDTAPAQAQDPAVMGPKHDANKKRPISVDSEDSAPAKRVDRRSTHGKRLAGDYSVPNTKTPTQPFGRFDSNDSGGQSKTRTTVHKPGSESRHKFGNTFDQAASHIAGIQKPAAARKANMAVGAASTSSPKAITQDSTTFSPDQFGEHRQNVHAEVDSIIGSAAAAIAERDSTVQEAANLRKELNASQTRVADLEQQLQQAQQNDCQNKNHVARIAQLEDEVENLTSRVKVGDRKRREAEVCLSNMNKIQMKRFMEQENELQTANEEEKRLKAEADKLKKGLSTASERHGQLWDWSKELSEAAKELTTECSYMTAEKHGEVGRRMDALRKLVE